MATFKQDTTPPTRDPSLPTDINWDKTRVLTESLRPTQTGPLRPGDQFIDPMSGSVRTVLSRKEEERVAKEQRDRERAQLAAGLLSEKHQLTVTRVAIAARQAELDQKAAAVKALKAVRPSEMTYGEAARRRAIRMDWVLAAEALENGRAGEQAQLLGIERQSDALRNA